MFARDLFKGILRLLFAQEPKAFSSFKKAFCRPILRSSISPSGILVVLFWLTCYIPTYGQWIVPAIAGPGPNTAVSMGNNCFEMTNGGGQRAVIWNTNTLNLNNPFNLGFSVRFDAWGADGLAFVLQNAGTSAAGGGGNAIGFGDAIPPDPFYSAIVQSIAIELDTWDNTGAGVADVPADHIAMHTNGNTTVATAGPVSALAAGTDVTDNVCRRMRVAWEPSTNTLDVFFRGILRLSTNIDLINTVFGGNPNVNWGFTASSGGIPMRIEICADRYWANAGPDRSVCLNDTLHIAASGGASYLWNLGMPTLSNPNIPNPIFYANAVGPVQLELDVTSPIGCVDRDTAIITVEANPVADPGGPFTQCLGTNVVVGAASNPNYSYLWSPGGNLSSTIISNPTFSSSTLGPQALQLVVTDNSTTSTCRDTASTTVTVLDTPNVSISASLAALCAGQSSTLTANGVGPAPLTYVWSTTATTAAIGVSVPNTYSVTVTDGNGCISSNFITIGSLSSPSTFIGNDTTVCPAQSINLDAGVGFSNYAWSNGSAVQTIVPNLPGTYSVTVTDVNGCLGSDTMVLANFPQPIVSIGPDTAVCFGDSLVLNATAGFTTYLWSNGQTTSNNNAVSPSTFDVTVTDAQGCQASDTMIFSWHPNLVPNLGPDIVTCTGGTSTLDAGAGYTAYLWSTGATSQTILASAPGTYSVTVTDLNTCQASDTLVFSWAGSLPVNLGIDTIICSGDSLLLDAGFPGSSYVWSGGQSSMQIQVALAGQYSVTVTDGSGCVGTDTMNLGLAPLPIINLGADTTICSGTTLALNAGNGGSNFVWTSGEFTQQIQAAAAGQYGVTVTDILGCTNSDSIVLAIQLSPSPNLGQDIQICPGGNAILNASGSGGTFSWSNGSNGNTLTVGQAGTFWVRETDGFGCQGFDTLIVSLLPLPIVSFGALLPTYCLQDAAEILTGLPIGGTFSTNVGPGIFDPPTAGIGQHWVSYTFTDSLGCTSIDSQTTFVSAPPTTAQAGPDLNGTANMNLAANIPMVGTGHWESLSGIGTFANSNSANTQFSANSTSPIEIVWIIENPPCPESRDTLLITFEGVQIPTGFSPNGDGINDLFVIRGIESFPDAKISVFNRWGERVWEKSNYRNDWNGTNQNNQPLSDDTYFFVLEYAGKSSSNYLVLKR